MDTTEVWQAILSMVADGGDFPAWMLDSAELPVCLPPFEQAVLTAPNHVIVAVTYDLEDPDDCVEGLFVGEELNRLVGDSRFGTSDGESKKWEWPHLPPTARWLVEFNFLSRSIDESGSHIAWLMPVDGDGKSLGVSGTVIVNPPPGLDDRPQIHTELISSIRMAGFAISLMHCKNVKVEETYEHLSRQVRRARARKGEPIISYRVLKVGSPSAHGTSGPGQADHLTAMHLCRGHFKTYTADAPLFGHIVGTYWWSPQLRGNPAEGIILKDYEVAPS